jgi:hypothetical protein
VIENAIRAAKLDVDFYNAAERDETLTGQAAMLVAIVSLISAFGIFWQPGDQPFFSTVIWSIVGGLLAWVIWAALTSWIGTQFFGGQTNLGEMLRVLGFAQAPRVLGLIPFLGWVGAVWALIASVVAIREGQDFTTGKALGTAIVGWLVVLLVTAILPIAIL